MGSDQEFVEIKSDIETENELLSAGRNWRVMFDALPDLICILDDRFRIIWVNKAMAERIGPQKAECIGSTCYKTVHGTETHTENCPHARTLKDGAIHTVEVYEQNLGGYFLVTTSPLTDTSGKVIGSIHVARDINERKALEKKLEEERNRAAQYLNISRVMFCALDSEGRVTLINPKGCEILGYDEEEIIGKDWFDHFLPERLRDKVKGVFSQLMAGDVSPVEYYENQVIGKDGDEKMIAFHNTIIQDEAGNIAGILFSGEDITERKKAVDALARSEERYRIVADNTYDWEFWISPDNRCLYSSPSCRKITGFSAEEIEKNPDLLDRLIHPDDLNVFREHRHAAREMKNCEDIEFRIIRPDGSTVWISHCCQPVYDDEGRFIGTRGSNRDVTLRKSIEEERKKLVLELQNALAKVKQLSGMLPICSSCKKIRDDKGYWNQIESYIRKHSEAKFTHGLCPDCIRKLYPEVYMQIYDKKRTDPDADQS